MSDQKPEGDIEKPDDHSEASLVPHSTDLVRAKASDEQPQKPQRAPKEIVLQRLSPHSSWDDPSFKDSAPHQEPLRDMAADAPNKRVLSLAAIVAIAAAVGAATGSAATFGIGQFNAGKINASSEKIAAAAAADHARMLESALAKVNTEIAALKAAASTQATKIAKLNETTDKLKAAEATGSVSAPSQAAQTQAPAAPQPNRLPIVEGWVLRDVMDGIATVQGRPGIFEVFPGDPLPGVGRVDAIRRQDGRWVVVTTRGLIVAR